ncbi:MAG: Fe-S cluster assembly ATPase SufC [Chloroflexi bacterium]|nr:Fe-S cluster assembly ATPase SufC [Chloroflexota bacterium]
MLEVTNLHARVVDAEDGEILKGLNLTVKSGEIHAIMGPNGSGKSTFANVLAGRPDYEVTEGDIKLDGESILETPPNERAHKGIFLAFQYPAEIPGVRPWQFMKAALDSRNEAHGEKKLSVREFSKLFDSKVAEVKINPDLMKRSLNEGFSGGEKKRNEMLQLAILEPRLAVLDETDSGLDVDAMGIVANAVNALRSPERSFIIVTHYVRLLHHITPDIVHVLADGRLVETGGPELAEEVEREGYKRFLSGQEAEPAPAGA